MAGRKYTKPFSCKHERLFVPLLLIIPTNCSAASLLSQFFKHSNSADLLRKSLHSHVWAGRKYTKPFSCEHERLFVPPLLIIPTNCSAASLLSQFFKHSNSADLLRKSLHSHVWAGRKYTKPFSCEHERFCVFSTLVLSYAVYVVCEEHYGGSGIGSFGGAL